MTYQGDDTVSQLATQSLADALWLCHQRSISFSDLLGVAWSTYLSECREQRVDPMERPITVVVEVGGKGMSGSVQGTTEPDYVYVEVRDYDNEVNGEEEGEDE